MTTVPCWARVRGPLAPYAEGFRVELERLGYTPLTAAKHVRLLAHLSRWLAREGVDASGLTPATVDAYFAERRAAGYVGHVTGRALQRARRNDCSSGIGTTSRPSADWPRRRLS